MSTIPRGKAEAMYNELAASPLYEVEDQTTDGDGNLLPGVYRVVRNQGQPAFIAAYKFEFADGSPSTFGVCYHETAPDNGPLPSEPSFGPSYTKDTFLALQSGGSYTESTVTIPGLGTYTHLKDGGGIIVASKWDDVRSAQDIYTISY